MTRSVSAPADVLGPGFAALHGEFVAHLLLERDRSPHTVRAYAGDLASLLQHAERMGVVEIGQLDLAVLRSWLAKLRTTGSGRATLARRGSTARTFTAWARRRGLIETDPGLLLATPKGRRPLPEVLKADEAARLVDAVDGQTPLDLRDRVVLELLYATAARVSELCGLDLDDVDGARRVVRVLGKGRKERTVPYGVPAQAALDAWLAVGRPGWAGPGSGPALLLG